MKFSLTHYNCVCALGSTPEAIFAAGLRGDQTHVRPYSDLNPAATTYLAHVDDPLPATNEPIEMRSNALLLAALAPIRDAVETVIERVGPARVGIVIGACNAGMREIVPCHHAVAQREAVDADYPMHLLEQGVPARYLQMILGTKGPALVVSTACSSSAKAFGVARDLLLSKTCDAVLVGGTDALTPFTIAGFHALSALSPHITQPMGADRHGITLGEGAALFLMEPDAPCAVELRGFGESVDAYHMTAPHPDGKGAYAAMQAALQEAGLTTVDAVNLHGTGTQHNDAMEAKAVSALLPGVPCMSTKPMTGHPLGAAGAVEAALCAMMLERQMLLPHLLEGPVDPTLPPINLVREARPAHLDTILSNSFAFGGSNVALVLGRSHA